MVPMVVPKFNTSHHTNTVGIMIWLTRSLWSNVNEVIMDRGLFIPKVLLEMRKRRFYGSALIKIDAIVLGRFI